MTFFRFLLTCLPMISFPLLGLSYAHQKKPDLLDPAFLMNKKISIYLSYHKPFKSIGS